MCTCDEEYRLSKEERQAIEHWHTVKRSVLKALLEDESDKLLQAAQAFEHCMREIQRLDKTIADLDPQTHAQARAIAGERRKDYRVRLTQLGPEAGAGTQIVEWLQRRIADAT